MLFLEAQPCFISPLYGMLHISFTSLFSRSYRLTIGFLLTVPSLFPLPRWRTSPRLNLLPLGAFFPKIGDDLFPPSESLIPSIPVHSRRVETPKLTCKKSAVPPPPDVLFTSVPSLRSSSCHAFFFILLHVSPYIPPCRGYLVK